MSFDYSVPRRGGSFEMPHSVVSEQPLPAEFAYINMIAVYLLTSVNASRVSLGLPLLAKLALEHECVNVGKARVSFSEGGYHVFVCNYNLLNRYLLVAYPVAYHDDHLNQPSLENKLLLVDYTQPGTSSRSGSTFGNHFYYALLDWGHIRKRSTQWVVANHVRLDYIGVNPNAPVRQSTLDSLTQAHRREMNSFAGGGRHGHRNIDGHSSAV